MINVVLKRIEYMDKNRFYHRDFLKYSVTFDYNFFKCDIFIRINIIRIIFFNYKVKI